MKKIYKFLKSFLFISHWEFIYLNVRIIFDKEFWFVFEKYFFGLDIGYWLEELLKFLSYEIPKESFKYIPIFFFLKYIWIKK